MANIYETYDVDLKVVQQFKDFGTFKNNIDSAGNLQILNSSVENISGSVAYAMFSLKSLNYDESQIIDAESIHFTEFTTSEKQVEQNIQNILEKYDSVIAENKLLNDTINSLTERYDNTEDKTVIESMKQQIIELRIQLGQGNVESDFDSDFPFLPTQ